MNDSTGRMSRRDALGYLGAAGRWARWPPGGWAGRPPPTSSSSASSTSAAGRLRLQPGAGAGAPRRSRRCPASRSSSRRRSPETIDVQKTMERMIEQDGATLLFPTSFGYFDPHMLKVAEKYPEGDVRPLRRPLDRRQAPEERRQLLRLHRRVPVPQRRRRRPRRARSKKLGFIAAKPIPQVLRNINAFTLGARSVDPKITTQRHLHRRLVAARQGGGGREQPRSTRAWTCSPATSTARRSSSRRPSAAASSCAATTPTRRRSRPKGYLTGAEWNWVTPYTDSRRRTRRRASRWQLPARRPQGGFVKTSAYGTAVSARRRARTPTRSRRR